MTIPMVSVIVPGHNASTTLEACLSSLRCQDWPKDRLEILYLDDASTDGSAEIASKYADRVVRLEGLPGGPARARNRGVEEACGEIVVFLDADILAPPATLGALVGKLMEDGSLDAVFGSYDSEPKDPGIVSQYRNLLHHFVHQTSRCDASTFWAGCGAVRKQSFERAGGFDTEQYQRAMIEDIELGHRMRGLGMRIRLDPSIQVKHLKRWTLFRMVQADIFSRGIPWMRLLFRDGPGSGEVGDLNLKISGMLSVALVWSAAFLLILSFRLPKLVYGVCIALGSALILNLPTYRFFRRVRGPSFALMVLPLNVLYHFYNGASFLGGVLYRLFIDRPLPGLKSIGARLQRAYWSYRSSRHRRRASSRRVTEKHDASGTHGK
jgi:glycosyltransferase involved in cell wall biosynthesis